MSIVYWIVTLALVAFEGASGLGKVLRWQVAVDAMDRLGVPDPAMAAFGGLEVGAAGVILYSLFDRSGPNEMLVPIAVSVIVGLMVVMLVLQFRADEPNAAMVGPVFVIALAGAFTLLRGQI